LTRVLGGGPTRLRGVGNEEAKTNHGDEPRPREDGALVRPPIKYGARPFGAKERGDQTSDDYEYSKGPKYPRSAWIQCGPE